jgi:hypothetical protein
MAYVLGCYLSCDLRRRDRLVGTAGPDLRAGSPLFARADDSHIETVIVVMPGGRYIYVR